MINSKKNNNVNKATLNYNTLVLILGLAGFTSAADNWFISPVLPAIAAGFSIPTYKAGLILTAYMIPYGAMQPVYGFFSDTFSKIKVLKIILSGFAIGTLGCAFSQSILILCIFRTITGFFAAGIIAVSLGFIGDTFPPSNRQFYVGKFMGMVFLGQGLSAGLGGTFARYITWRISFVLFVILSIFSIMLLSKIKEKNTHLGADEANSKFLPEVKKAILDPKGKIIFSLAPAAGFTLLGIYSYIGAFLHDAINLNYLWCGIITMFFGFSGLLAGRIVGKLESKIGRHKLILLGLCLGIFSTLTLRFLPNIFTTLIVVIILGFAYIFVQSTIATMAFEVPSKAKGLPSGLIGLGLFGGGGIGSSFSGFILSKTNYSELWICFTILMILLTLIVYKIDFNK